MRMTPRKNEHGQILIMAAFALIALLGMSGLAIDSGRGYGVKAKLNSAVDAAAIAGARALANGDSDAVRIDNAKTAARNYYQANFPADYLGSKRGDVAIDAAHSVDGYWTISVKATADMPVSFLKVLGMSNVSVAAASQARRRDLDMILVIDTSGSLAPPISSASTMPSLKTAAINFINKFNSGPNGDRVGLVSFASGAVVDVPINKDGSRGFDRTRITNAINVLSAAGSTASAEGTRVALNELNAVPAASRSSLRVIVFFSDGAPNTVPAAFSASATGDLFSETSSGGRPDKVYYNNQRNVLRGNYSISTLPGSGFMINGLGNIPLAGRRSFSSWPTNSRCNVNKAARNMVEYVADAARGQAIKFYSIGLGASLNSLEINFCGYGVNEQGASIMKRLANTSDSDTYNAAQPQGVYAFAADASELNYAFTTIASEILRLSM
jgi:Flp pilus assembly protein TadG